MRLAIQTVLLPGDNLVDKFAAAKRYGFDGVEVAVGPEFDLADHLDDARRAVEASGLPIAAICTHPIHDPLVPDPAERAARFAALADLLRLADEVGAAGVVSVPVRPPHAFPALPDRDRGLADLAAEAFAVWVADLPAGASALFLEPLNRYEAFFLNRVGQAAALAEKIDHPRVQALGDLFHMHIEEADLAQPLREAGARLGHVHIADNNRFEPGAGCLDFRSPLAALKEMGYPGWLSIECWSPTGPRLSGDPAAVLPPSVRFLRSVWEAA